MTKKLENVRVDCLSTLGPKTGWRAAACFEMEGARYHIWFNTWTREREDVVYKNPLLSVERHSPEHFETRKLDATNKTNLPIVTALFAEIETRKLVAAALAQEAKKVSDQQREQAEAHRLYLKQQAGPDLFAALFALHDVANRANNLQHAGRPVPADVWAEMYQATQSAWAEIRKAEG